MGHRHSAPRLIDGGATDLPAQPQRESSPPRVSRRNRLQKPPGPGDRAVFSGPRRLSILDVNSSSPKQHLNNGSVASLDSLNASLPASPPSISNSSGPGSDVSGQLSRRPTSKSTCVASEDGLEEPSSAPAGDPVSLLRRKSLLLAAPPATITRRPGPVRSRRNTMPANSLDRVLETDAQRCMTPSGISVIGAFKRGSLRITNGCVSPAPSSAPTSPTLKPDAPRRSMDSMLDLPQRHSWESTRTTTIQVMVEDADTSEIKSKEYVQEHISTPYRAASSPTKSGVSETASNNRLHRISPSHGCSAPVDMTSSSNIFTKYTSPRLTIRHVHEDALNALEGRTPSPTCTVQYYDSPPRPRSSGDPTMHVRAPTLPEMHSRENFYSHPQYNGAQERLYTFEESVVTRREISRPLSTRHDDNDDHADHDLVHTDYTVSSCRVTLRSPPKHLQQTRSTANIPVINSGTDIIGPPQPLTKTPPTVQYVQVQDLPLDSKITGQEYYQRFSRRRSQLATSREYRNDCW